jgi:hypothetical protein
MDRQLRKHIDNLVKESIEEGKWFDRAAAAGGAGALLFGALTANTPEIPDRENVKDAMEELEFEKAHEHDSELDARMEKNDATPKEFFHKGWKYDNAVKENRIRSERRLNRIVESVVKKIIKKHLM